MHCLTAQAVLDQVAAIASICDASSSNNSAAEPPALHHRVLPIGKVRKAHCGHGGATGELQPSNIWERNATRFAGSKRENWEDASRVPSRWRHERMAAKTTTSPGFLQAVHDKRHLVYIVDQDALDSGPA